MRESCLRFQKNFGLSIDQTILSLGCTFEYVDKLNCCCCCPCFLCSRLKQVKRFANSSQENVYDNADVNNQLAQVPNSGRRRDWRPTISQLNFSASAPIRRDSLAGREVDLSDRQHESRRDDTKLERPLISRANLKQDHGSGSISLLGSSAQ